MKRMGMTMAVLLIGGSPFGCATEKTSGPTQSLVRARAMKELARTKQVAAPELREAEGLLQGAEAQYRSNPGSNMEYHLANLAASKFEVSMAEADRRATEQEYVSLLQRRSEELARRQAEGTTVKRTEEGTVLTLAGQVLFRFGDSELLPTAKERLGVLAEALKEHTEKVGIVIEGHADSKGPEEFNEELSRLRAESAKQFLIERGVEPERIEAIGHGERDPVATNDTPEGRANNRRIEIVVRDEA